MPSPDISSLSTTPGALSVLARDGEILDVPSNLWWLLDGPGGSTLAQAWALATGAGVRVSVVENWVNTAHADLNPTVPLTDLPPQTGDCDHGTQVAGLIFGRADNAVAGMGAAFGAEMVVTRLSISQTSTPQALAAGLMGQCASDVSNNSWGYSQGFADNFRTSAYAPFAEALRLAATEGRAGLGTVMVFAAGNGRMMINGVNRGDDSNFHNLTNARQSIAVGASDADGHVAFFSSPGANLLLSAPGLGLTTASGNGPEACGQAIVSGTSFAAPLVSGAVALMLEVNPDLGFRDVQEILALTSRPSTGAGAFVNAATGANGGGMTFDRDLGFGLLDAEAAVRLARHWSAQSTAANEAHVAVSLAPILAPDRAVAELTFDVSDTTSFLLDHAAVTLTLADGDLRDLEIDLVSPSGTIVALAEDLNAMGTRTYLDFTFSSVATWGEDAAGLWTVRLTHSDPDPALRYAIYQARLDLYGDHDTPDDTFVFTDAFADLARADPSRRVIIDSDLGVDELNFAASRHRVNVNLGTGLGQLNGVSFRLDGQFEAVVGSAVADRILGSTRADTLLGDDGADELRSGSGNDHLDGGSGADLMIGGPGDDTYFVDNPEDRVTESARGGYDTVIASVSFWMNAHPREIEALELAGTAGIAGNGNQRDNRIIGNDGANRLAGGAGADWLVGGNGNDTLIGGTGDDSLAGGAGRDYLYGGAGADCFLFNANSQANGIDLIRDFETNLDHIVLDVAMMSQLGGDLIATATGRNNWVAGSEGQLSYTASTGLLRFDPDGSTGDALPTTLVAFAPNTILSLADLQFL